ncbi:MAG: sulfite exporter TauE/SafE family protein [Methylothermaceae bacterium]|nr:sulfite exporter TauE/SafE family protein [Methylothermaceae bacterium]
MVMRHVTFRAEGMHCTSCEKVIELALGKLPGVAKVRSNFASQVVRVAFDPGRISLAEILDVVERKGYRGVLIDRSARRKELFNRVLGVILGVAGILLILYGGSRFVDHFQLPDLNVQLGYWAVLVVGLLTGFHCVGMCGGFVLSYTAKGAQEGQKTYWLHTQYAVGKLLSYTVLGAGFGMLGALISFTPTLRGIAAILAGAFLILYGFNMLHVFSAVRVGFTMPRFLSRFVRKETHRTTQPFVIGLLNGLMIACGPLQAMYVMAAGTGSALEGAKLLFIFGLGTLPLMFGFGFLASIISHRMTHKILNASGILVISLGLIMLNRGLAMTGSGYDFHTLLQRGKDSAPQLFESVTQESKPDKDASEQVIHMQALARGYEPNRFVLRRGVPVKWVIEGKELTGCNRVILVPKLNLEIELKPGTQTVEFTPREIGRISWSCWMGMLHGEFQVIDGVESTAKSQTRPWIRRGRVRSSAASLQRCEQCLQEE